jgi:hypothetical protein
MLKVEKVHVDVANDRIKHIIGDDLKDYRYVIEDSLSCNCPSSSCCTIDGGNNPIAILMVLILSLILIADVDVVNKKILLTYLMLTPKITGPFW